jgi:hypothetical protein
MEKMTNTTNVREMEPPPPGPVNYDQAVQKTASLPAVAPGENDVGSFKTGAQPKDDLGGLAKFK